MAPCKVDCWFLKLIIYIYISISFVLYILLPNSAVVALLLQGGGVFGTVGCCCWMVVVVVVSWWSIGEAEIIKFVQVF